jgi:hypothetical protein
VDENEGVGEDEDYDNRKQVMEEWQTLVHVCRRWRTIVVGSKNRLSLRLVCTSETPTRDTLDVWPALPLVIDENAFLSEGADNIVAALEYSDRVNQIRLRLGGSPMEIVLAAMEVPFPNLTCLVLYSNQTVTILPDSFLDGYAPSMKFLRLSRIPIPGLPGLLLRSIELCHLYLHSIPHSGYFSPEEFVTCLSALRNLLNISLQFESPLSRPDRGSRRPLPLTRTSLPKLGNLNFHGVSEYLEDLLVRIDAPQLKCLDVAFFNQIDFDTPQLVQFVGRTPRLNALEVAHLRFRGGAAEAAAGVSLLSLMDQVEENYPAPVNVKILCRELDWQVSSLEQLFTPFFPSILTLEDLYTHQTQYPKPDWKDNVEDALWLALLHPFTSVKNLYLSKEFAPRIAPVLQELVGGGTTELLPTLQNIFTEELEPSGPVQEAIGTFIAARRFSGHPIAVSRWERDLNREVVYGP